MHERMSQPSAGEIALKTVEEANNLAEANLALGDILAANDPEIFRKLIPIIVKKEKETSVQWLNRDARTRIGHRLDMQGLAF